MPHNQILRLSSLAVLGATLVVVGCNKRENNTTPDTTAVAPATPAPVDTAAGAVSSALTADTPDSEIVGALVAANEGEVTYSKLAGASAMNAEIKKLARQMVTDHQAMLTDVKALFKKANISPDTLNGKGKDFMDDMRNDVSDLKGKEAKDWNNEFVEEQIDGHQKVLDLLNDVDEDADNPDLKQMIETAKPKVQAHLDAWKALKDKLPKV
jgi:putative membrane protein